MLREIGARLLGTVGWVWGWDLPPGCGDRPNEVLAARALRTTLVGVLAWLVLQFGLIIPFLVVRKAATLVFSIALLLSVLVSVYYSRRGRVKLASWVVVASFWILLTADALLTGGISSQAVAGFLSVTVVTAWLFEYQVMLIAAGLFLGTTLGLALLETFGGAPPRYFPSPPLVVWSLLCLHLAVAVLPLSLVLRALNQALGDTRGRAAFNQAVHDSLTAHIAVIDANGVIVTTNQAWDRFAIENGSSSPAECGRGTNYLQACAKAASAGDPVARQALAGIRAVQKGSLRGFDLEYACDSPSEERWFEMHATRLGGADRSLVVSHENVTERKRTERELRLLNETLEQRVESRTTEVEDARRVALSMMQDADLQRENAVDLLKKLSESTSSQVMLWQAVENSPAVVMITDTEANIQYVNPKFVEVTGYVADEAVGKNSSILKSGSHTPEFYRHLWTTIKAGKTWRGEFCNRKKSGELFWESASISPVRDKHREIRQFLAIKEDVTEIKRTTEDLRQAKNAADAANRAKSAFLASMSHEIRTPLNAILGYSQLLLRDESLGAQSRESLRVINRSGEHLLAQINDVLEVSKIEAGQVGLEPAEFDLHAMLDDLAALFRLPIAEKGLEFEVTKAKDLPRYVIADGGKTRQVLVNLLGNAVKFTKQGYVRVGAAVNGAETGQAWLAVEIEDTGPGIAQEEMGQLFHFFEQTQSGRQTQSGTGLGLVISRDYARRMGGDISVASELGKGTVFRFEIPVAAGAAKPAGELRDDRRVAGLAPGQAPFRVLVADDQDTNRGWLSALLESVGFEVREARNGREALESWQTWRPELILMDMRMPLMDGYEATRQIRSAPGGNSTVIIAVTASTLDERMPAMMNVGVDDLVCKPFKEGHLFDKIRTHLDVRYRYDESEEVTKTQSGESVSSTAVSLAGLPAELLAGMRQAILGCDMDGFLQFLPQVAELYPSAAASLRTLAEKYDYDGLARIVSEAR